MLPPGTRRAALLDRPATGRLELPRRLSPVLQTRSCQRTLGNDQTRKRVLRNRRPVTIVEFGSVENTQLLNPCATPYLSAGVRARAVPGGGCQEVPGFLDLCRYHGPRDSCQNQSPAACPCMEIWSGRWFACLDIAFFAQEYKAGNPGEPGDSHGPDRDLGAGHRGCSEAAPADGESDRRAGQRRPANRSLYAFTPCLVSLPAAIS